jgi:hypothetical protein
METTEWNKGRWRSLPEWRVRIIKEREPFSYSLYLKGERKYENAFSP